MNVHEYSFIFQKIEIHPDNLTRFVMLAGRKGMVLRRGPLKVRCVAHPVEPAHRITEATFVQKIAIPITIPETRELTRTMKGASGEQGWATRGYDMGLL
jgi:hypothetical protein